MAERSKMTDEELLGGSELLRKLAKITEPGIRAMAKRMDETSLSRSEHVILACTRNSPFTLKQHPLNSDVGVAIVKRQSLADVIHKDGGMPELAKQLDELPSCDHHWVMLANQTEGRYCCIQCDLHITI